MNKRRSAETPGSADDDHGRFRAFGRDLKGTVAASELAEVDIGFTRLLMPLDSTAKQITNAQTLLDQHKYYEANMALKAAEDGLNVETVMLVQPTKSGKTGDQPQQQQTKTNSPS